MRLPKGFRFATDEVVIHREGDRVVLEPVQIERDAKGWPVAWWALAGAGPEFELGARARTVERDRGGHGQLEEVGRAEQGARGRGP